MATVEQGILSQLKNIEAEYGKPMSAWLAAIRKSGHSKHSDIVAWLKTKHGMKHGAAHRVALVVRAELDETAGSNVASVDPVTQLYTGKKATLLPVHRKLMASILKFGGDIDVAPKKGYLSLRRKKQFAMIRPAAAHLDLGLVLPGASITLRLESAATFNALFTHRVRVQDLAGIDRELISWLREAYELAGKP
jgi:Domain of unknown function (DUF5655)/Domain of unknown function (DUF4287)